MAAKPDPGKQPRSGYDTNLASEFYVLSCLHRIGLTANLTLGNKKGVDIVVVRKAGDAVTVEVKGTAKKYDWVVNKLSSPHPDRHFVALVSFENRITDPTMPAPRVWVIPFPEIEIFRRTYKGDMNTVSRSAVLRTGSRYENAWNLIET
jgi:hypothetical protein